MTKSCFYDCRVCAPGKEQLVGLLAVVERCRKYHKHMILSRDLNSKSITWNIKKSNVCGNLLEDYLHRSSLICINDGEKTK